MRISTTKTILYLKDVQFLHRHYETAQIITVDRTVAYLKSATIKHVLARGSNYNTTFWNPDTLKKSAQIIGQFRYAQKNGSQAGGGDARHYKIKSFGEVQTEVARTATPFTF